MSRSLDSRAKHVVSGVDILFLVSEEDNVIAICNTCSTRVMRGGKNSIKHNKSN